MVYTRRSSDSASVAYIRWNPVRTVNDEEFYGSNSTPMREFQRFNELPPMGPHRPQSRYVFTDKWISKGIKILSFVVIFGLGWIFGFIVRWGVHNFYTDSFGHCVVPSPFSYSREIGEWAQYSIIHKNLNDSFYNFTKHPHHRTGSPESLSFIKEFTDRWREYGIDYVDLHEFDGWTTEDDSKIPNGLSIYDENNTLIWSLYLKENDTNHIAFSADGIGRGSFVYGHYGRLEDFIDLKNEGIIFNKSVVLIKSSTRYSIGSTIQNAESFGVLGVVVFPDPYAHIISKDGHLGSLSRYQTVTQSVKFVPGDPDSPYLSSGKHKPSIPVIGLSYDRAEVLVRNYVNAYNIKKNYLYDLPLMPNLKRNFTAKVEVYSNKKSIKLKNIIGVMKGRYEPNRYIIIGCHHDTWHQGAAKAGLGHSVLSELVRTFGMMSKNGWKPARSILFASWDGEELGNLGSTAWLYRHTKELNSRAIAYIDLDYLIQGKNKIHISSSPLLRRVIEESAKEVDCDFIGHHGGVFGSDHTLYDEWVKASKDSKKRKSSSNSPHYLESIEDLSFSPFQSIAGISSIDVSIRDSHFGTTYPYIGTVGDTPASVEKYLDPGFNRTVILGRFVTVLTLKLIMTPKLPFDILPYAEDIVKEENDFVKKYGTYLSSKFKIKFVKLKKYIDNFESAAKAFSKRFETSENLQLEMLEHKEYKDILLDIERAFLAPTGNPYRHVIQGPHPLNPKEVVFFPRLAGAIEYALKINASSQIVEKELFLILDAVQAATDILKSKILHT